MSNGLLVHSVEPYNIYKLGENRKQSAPMRDSNVTDPLGMMSKVARTAQVTPLCEIAFQGGSLIHVRHD
jgi:hypothetical protein